MRTFGLWDSWLKVNKRKLKGHLLGGPAQIPPRRSRAVGITAPAAVGENLLQSFSQFLGESKFKPYGNDPNRLGYKHTFQTHDGKDVEVNFNPDTAVPGKNYSASFKIGKSYSAKERDPHKFYVIHRVKNLIGEFIKEHKPDRLKITPHDENREIEDKKDKAYETMSKVIAKMHGGTHVNTGVEHIIRFKKKLEEAKYLYVRDVGLWAPWLKKYGYKLKGDIIEGPPKRKLKLQQGLTEKNYFTEPPMRKEKYSLSEGVSGVYPNKKEALDKISRMATRAHTHLERADKKVTAAKTALEYTRKTSANPLPFGMFQKSIEKLSGIPQREANLDKAERRRRAYGKMKNLYFDRMSALFDLPPKDPVEIKSYKGGHYTKQRSALFMKGKEINPHAATEFEGRHKNLVQHLSVMRSEKNKAMVKKRIANLKQEVADHPHLDRHAKKRLKDVFKDHIKQAKEKQAAKEAGLPPIYSPPAKTIKKKKRYKTVDRPDWNPISILTSPGAQLGLPIPVTKKVRVRDYSKTPAEKAAAKKEKAQIESELVDEYSDRLRGSIGRLDKDEHFKATMTELKGNKAVKARHVNQIATQVLRYAPPKASRENMISHMEEFHGRGVGFDRHLKATKGRSAG